jgi:hypothetical protein
MRSRVRLRSSSGLSGHGQLKPEQQEIAQLKREVAKLKAEIYHGEAS